MTGIRVGCTGFTSSFGVVVIIVWVSHFPSSPSMPGWPARQRPAKANGGRSSSASLASANHTSVAGRCPLASRKALPGIKQRPPPRNRLFHIPFFISLSSRALFQASGFSGLPVFSDTLGVIKPQCMFTNSRAPSSASRTTGAGYLGQIAFRGSALPSRSRSAETAKNRRIKSGDSVLAYKLHKCQVSLSLYAARPGGVSRSPIDMMSFGSHGRS